VATLGDIAAITKAQTLRSSSDASANEIQEASPGEFPEHGYLCVGPRKRLVEADDLRRYSAQRIQPGDVLLSTKGAIGRTAGTTMPNVSLLDLRKLPIVIATVQEQHELRSAFEMRNELQLQISELQVRQTTAARDVWRALDLADSGDPA
jgi:hypothetical protein